MDKRLIYRVILKVLALLAVFLLLLVFVNSLFTVKTTFDNVEGKLVNDVEIDVSAMRAQEIKKIRWGGKEVSVLKRADGSFFTYFNVGDSGNCPLFKEVNALKDICTGTRFGFNGKVKSQSNQKFRLKTPPHMLLGKVLIVGRGNK